MCIVMSDRKAPFSNTIGEIVCSDSQNIAHFTLGFRIDISLKFPTLHFKVNASLPYYTALVNMQWNVCLLLSIFYNILKYT